MEHLLKKTALTSKHESIGAKMVPFAGYSMPVQYEGVTIEHETVRKGVGIFDVSHMGEFLVEGEQALNLIQSVCSNDASKLLPGKAQYSCMPNSKGGIVDDLIVYMLDEFRYMLVVNASNIEKDWDWISLNNSSYGAQLTNISDQISLLAVQGPKAIETLQILTAINLSDIPYYSFVFGELAGVQNVLISATGYTGSGGFEIYVSNSDVLKIWDAVMDAGNSFGIKPIGLAARDTLRLEMGYCLYGNDIDDTTSPLEAGLGWITKFNKSFTNSLALAKQKEQGVSRKLVGIELVEKGIPRQGYEIVNEKGSPIGVITSGTMAPSLNKGIGLGYLSIDYAEPNTPVWIRIRKNDVPAKVVRPPFFKV